MNKDSKIYLAGHTGLVGSAILRRLRNDGYNNIIIRSHSDLDLTRQKETESFFADTKPAYVFLAAARVGGILANQRNPAEFIYANMMIAANVIDAAHRCGVKKLLNLGSSCIYPRLAPQPLKEEYLLTGDLEPTNEAYAIAKISAIKICKFYNEQYGTDYISLMPTNLYGPGDNYDLETSHVLPAMIRKFHEGRQSGGPVVLWGDGTPRREFLYSDDLADAALFVMRDVSSRDIGEFINVGTGTDVPIQELAGIVAEEVGYSGKVVWNRDLPNGTPRKVLDVERISSLGWQPRIGLRAGIRKAYEHYQSGIIERAK